MRNIRYILLALSSLIIIFIGLEAPGLLMTLLGGEFILYIILIVVDFLVEKRLTLFQIWISAFIFVILSEMIVICYEESNISVYTNPIIFLFIANNLVLLGYLMNKRMFRKPTKSYVITTPLFLSVVIWALIIAYFLSYAYIIQKALYSGARGGSGSALGTFDFASTLIKGAGQLLPALIAYYYRYCKKSNKWESLIAVAPVLLIQLLLGSRYSLLFAILPYLLISGIVTFERFNFKKMIITAAALLFLVFITGMVKQLRNTALIDYLNGAQVTTSVEDNAPLIVKMAREMSPEGIVEMTVLSDDYFSKHEHHYGRESGFILYFWIPRSVWPTKPTQLDHWLIREYMIVSENHSSASGFAGELKADFGWFSLFFVFFMGYFLKNADNCVKKYLAYSETSFNTVIAAAIIPYIFFFVRSPLTSSFSFIFEVVLFLILRKFFCKAIIKQ